MRSAVERRREATGWETDEVQDPQDGEDGRSAMEDEDEGQSDSESDSDAEDGRETVQLVGQEDGSVVQHNQVDTYRYRPAELEALCPYTFFSNFALVKKDIRAGRGAGASGPSAMRRISLQPAHPLSNTHWLRQHPRALVPRLEGPHIPRKDHEASEQREKYAKNVMIVFSAWRTVEGILDGHASWQSALAAFQPSKEISSHISRLDLHHRMETQASTSRRDRGDALGPDSRLDRDERCGMEPEDIATDLPVPPDVLEAQLELAHVKEAWSLEAVDELRAHGLMPLVRSRWECSGRCIEGSGNDGPLADSTGGLQVGDENTKRCLRDWGKILKKEDEKAGNDIQHSGDAQSVCV